jgi:hypothetical protein
MKKKNEINTNRISSIFLLTILVLSVSCSSNISLTTPEINRALPENTPESCEKFAGYWYSNEFKDTEDEDKIICGDKPCNDGNRGGSGFILTCTNGKISGEVILAWSTPHSDANTSMKNTKTPEPIKEYKTSFKDIRIENDVLYLSFFHGVDKDCLTEISVSPKDKFLLGKYQTPGCRKPLGYAEPEKGSILLKKR